MLNLPYFALQNIANVTCRRDAVVAVCPLPGVKRKSDLVAIRAAFDPERASCGAREQAEEPLNPFDVRGSDDASPFVDIGHDASFELIAAGRPRVVAQRFEPLDGRGFRQNIGYHPIQAIRD